MFDDAFWRYLQAKPANMRDDEIDKRSAGYEEDHRMTARFDLPQMFLEAFINFGSFKLIFSFDCNNHLTTFLTLKF